MVGDGDTPIAGVASLHQADPTHLSFLVSARYLSYFHRTRAGAVLVSGAFRAVAEGPATRIVVANPLRAVAHALTLFHPAPEPRWSIHPSASIGRGTVWEGRIMVERGAMLGADVRLGAGCRIGAHAVIEDGVTMGAECSLGPHTVVHHGTRMGHRVVLKAGARVGASGFGYASSLEGPTPIPHIGQCVIEDDVDIGANTTVDRGMLDDTVVGRGTKIDNLVQIGHNVRIGARCVIMGQAGLGGSTVLEDDVMLGGQAGLAGHLRIGARARVAAQGGVIGDVPANTTVSGYPARPHRAVLRQTAALARLTSVVDQLERLAEP